MATLIVKSPDGSEREVALVKRITSVGRDPENDVAVPDPALPRTALHIHFDGKDYNAAAHEASDMSVNGKRRSTCRLGPGDRIRVAATELFFDPAPRAAASRPQAGRRLLALETLVRFLGAAPRRDGPGAAPRRAARRGARGDPRRQGLPHPARGRGDDGARRAERRRETIENAMSRVSDSIIQRVVEIRRPLVVADALHDAEWSGSTSVVNLKLCSVMCAPHAEGGRVRGHLPRERQRRLAVRRPRARGAHRLHGAGVAARPERDAPRLPPPRERRAQGGGPVEAVRRSHRRGGVDARGVPPHREGRGDRHLGPRLGRDRNGQEVVAGRSTAARRAHRGRSSR